MGRLFRLLTIAIVVAGCISLVSLIAPVRNWTPEAKATLPTPTPTRPAGLHYHAAIDCDTGAAGVQSSCVVPPSTTSVDIGVVVGNDDASYALTMDFVDLEVDDSDISRLDPPNPTTGPITDRNPDLNDAVLTGTWSCGQVISQPDGLGGAESAMNCQLQIGPVYIVPAASEVTVAFVHYNVPILPNPATVTLSLPVMNFGTNPTRGCTTIYADPCFGATIQIAVAPTVTATPTETLTATPTATSTPTVPPIDTDGDGFYDALDNCPLDPNPLQENARPDFIDLHVYGKLFDDTTVLNSTTLGDACSPDIDGDGFPNDTETAGPPCASATVATDPLKLDTDGDGFTDRAECMLGTDPTNAASKPPTASVPGDADHDMLPDALEAALGTNPNVVDTDGDKLNDGVEFLYHGSDPTSANTDGDICTDGKEAASLNADHTVNSTDQLIVAQSFGATGGPKYVQDFDVNRDRNINSTDMLIQAKTFGPC